MNTIARTYDLFPDTALFRGSFFRVKTKNLANMPYYYIQYINLLNAIELGATL